MTLMAAFLLANVYHATKSNGQEFTVKVYTTSVLVFKDRDRYVQGDYRENGQDMGREGNEEFDEVKSCSLVGIRCPTSLLLRLHVLVMEFIGKTGWATPRLKDAVLSLNRLRESYLEIIITMRTLSQECKLVHGHLSEYNILYFERLILTTLMPLISFVKIVFIFLC